MTAIICTHDPNHVLWFCDKVVVLGNNGCIVASGDPPKILTNSLLIKLYGDMCYVKDFDNMQMVIPRDNDVLPAGESAVANW